MKDAQYPCIRKGMMIARVWIGQQHDVPIVGTWIDRIKFTLEVVSSVVDTKQAVAVDSISLEKDVLQLR